MDETTMQAQAAEAQAENTEEQANEAASTVETASPETKEPSSVEELDSLANEILADRQPEAKQTEQAAEKQEEPEKAEKATTEDEDHTPNRVRLTDLAEQDKKIVNTAVRMVRDGLAPDIATAIARISPQPTQAQTEAAEQEQESQAADPEAEHNEQVTNLTQEIEDIRVAIAKAKEDFDDQAERELTELLIDKKGDLKLAQFRHDQEQTLAAERERMAADSKFEAEYTSFRDKANELYPEGADENSPLYAQIRQEVEWFEKNNPAFFQTPNYPLAIAGIAATKLGIAPSFARPTAKAAPTAQATKQPLSAAPRSAARPTTPLVGGNATTGGNDALSSLRTTLDSARSIDDLDRLAEAALA